ncbi:MAG: phosphoadenylyl-sulfate reductase [Alphaproteobacteria bacterium]|nr:phosphoadenylyl-sulfate reductase [Alphaproteobacteria bacterium]
MPSRTTGARERAAALRASRLERFAPLDLLAEMIHRQFAGRICIVSSFGTESIVLLHLAAEVDRSVPVIFLDTGKLFAETLSYQREIVARLGLGDVRVVTPDAGELAVVDPDGDLWSRDPDACCRLRKTAPLARALEGFDAWMSGRKRYQRNGRESLPLVEEADGRVKINPLALWSREEIETHCALYGLPRHPLLAAGYVSIGCAPCTTPVRTGEDERAGRWRGTAKTECGIHWTEAGPVRSAAP